MPCAAHPSDAVIDNLSGGEKTPGRPCADYCYNNPMYYCLMSQPTTWMLSRYCGWKEHLRQYKGTVIAVTHDRYFLDNVAGWILELDRGEGYSVER